MSPLRLLEDGISYLHCVTYDRVTTAAPEYLWIRAAARAAASVSATPRILVAVSAILVEVQHGEDLVGKLNVE